eukprot:6253561-Pyramimonas_sp.AAC.1
MNTHVDAPPGSQQPAVKPATGMLGFADLQSAANTVRKNIAQTTSQFMSTTTQGSTAPPPPDMRHQAAVFAGREEFPRGMAASQLKGSDYTRYQ